MYNPTIGTFLSEDPTMFEGLDENLRRYVKNHPTYATDPDGLIERTRGRLTLGAVPLQFSQQWTFELDDVHDDIAEDQIALIQFVDATISITGTGERKEVKYVELIGIIDKDETDFTTVDTWAYGGRAMPADATHAVFIVKAKTQAWAVTDEVRAQLDGWRVNGPTGRGFAFDANPIWQGMSSGTLRSNPTFDPPKGQRPLEEEKSPVVKVDWRSRRGGFNQCRIDNRLVRPDDPQ